MMARARDPGPKPLATLLSVLLMLTLPLTVQAQALPTRGAMPDPVVLVLKRTDETSIEPSTGIVVGRNRSGEPLVLVPASFTAGDQPIYVMDVGSDLLLDGLPARREREAEGSPLALIAVPGLERRPLSVTFNAPETDHELRLAAWPPAQLLANGALPFWVPVDVAGKTGNDPQRLLDDGFIPNLSGPLLDLCGQAAGIVLANGEPAIDGSAAPEVLLIDDLLRAAEALGVELRLEACMQVAPVGGLQLTSPLASGRSTTAERPPDPFSMEAIMDDARLGKGALVFLLSALVSGLLFWYLVKRRAAAQRKARIRRTLAQDTVTFSATGLPTRSTRDSAITRTSAEPKTFNPGTRPPGTNGWLRIEGKHADGRPLRAVTAVSEAKFQAVIGRAGVALAADGPGISRKHAVIVGEGGRLTISDLGSRNGTFVNNVRCQPDEIFFLQSEDTVLLGAAEIKITLQPAKGPTT